MAMFSFNNRSVFDLNNAKKYLSENPDVIAMMCSEPTIDVNILVLQNLVNSVTESIIEYGNCEFIIWTNEKGNFLLSDRPFLYEPIDGISVLTISRHFCITVKKNAKPTYCYQKIDEGGINLINSSIVKRAKNWIIAVNRKDLEKYASYCLPTDGNDGLEFKKVQYLKNGYSL